MWHHLETPQTIYGQLEKTPCEWCFCSNFRFFPTLSNSLSTQDNGLYFRCYAFCPVLWGGDLSFITHTKQAIFRVSKEVLYSFSTSLPSGAHRRLPGPGGRVHLLLSPTRHQRSARRPSSRSSRGDQRRPAASKISIKTISHFFPSPYSRNQKTPDKNGWRSWVKWNRYLLISSDTLFFISFFFDAQPHMCCRAAVSGFDGDRGDGQDEERLPVWRRWPKKLGEEAEESGVHVRPAGGILSAVSLTHLVCQHVVLHVTQNS